ALTPWRNRSGSLPPHWLPAREFQLGRLLCQPEHPVAIAHWREQVDAPLSFHEFAAYDFNCCLIPAEGVQHAFCQASTAICDSDALALTNAPHAKVVRGLGVQNHPRARGARDRPLGVHSRQSGTDTRYPHAARAI